MSTARTRYRLVSDYGFGDKAWLERDLPAEQAVAAFNSRTGLELATIDECINYDHLIYRLEVDDWDDEEDWDWMDS